MSEQHNIERLNRFISWLTPIIFIFALVYGVIGFWFSDLATQLSAGIIALYGVALLGAFPFLRQGRITLAVMLVGGGLIGAIVIMTALIPALFPNNAVVPVLVATLLLQYLSQKQSRWSLFICGLATTCITLMGELLPSYSQLPESLLSILRISSLTGTVAFTLFLLAQFNERVQDLVVRMRLINTTLEQRNLDLETQSQTLYEQLQNEQRLMAQVAALEAPVVTIARGMLFAPIVGHLDAQRARALQGKLAHEVYAQKATSIIIDLTGVIDVEDSEIFELIRMIQTIKLLGCEVIVSGISANLAQRLTELQIMLGHYAKIKHNPHAALEAAGINQQVLF